MNAPVPKLVLAVDDHAAARGWLTAAVEAAFPGARVLACATAAEAVARLESEAPDLALLDLGLPDASGLEVLKLLRRRVPGCAVIIATVFDDDEHLFAALRQGAQGYVLKEQARETLAQLLRGTIAGEPALSPGIARRLIGFFSRPLAAPQAGEQPLTSRECEVLQLVSRGLSIPETARALEISPHTAHGYVKDLYRKLEVSSRAEAAVVATRLGLA